MSIEGINIYKLCKEGKKKKKTKAKISVAVCFENQVGKRVNANVAVFVLMFCILFRIKAQSSRLYYISSV